MFSGTSWLTGGHLILTLWSVNSELLKQVSIWCVWRRQISQTSIWKPKLNRLYNKIRFTLYDEFRPAAATARLGCVMRFYFRRYLLERQVRVHVTSDATRDTAVPSANWRDRDGSCMLRATDSCVAGLKYFGPYAIKQIVAPFLFLIIVSELRAGHYKNCY